MTHSTRRLEGRRAFVTGAAQGIGLAIADAFVAEGAAVALADVSGDAARREAERLGATGARTHAATCDVRDDTAVARSIREAADALGGIDTVVCCAATFTPLAPLHELGEPDWLEAMDVNLNGAYRVCRHGIPHLLAAGGGSIILLASQMARVANAGQAAYCTTKGGLVQLAKGIALDYADRGIRSNTLSPGGIATARMTRRFGSMEEAQRVWGPRHPMGRLGEASEIARSAVYLASDDASFMTGADLLVDGGYSAW